MDTSDIRSQFIVDEQEYTKEKIQKFAEKALKLAKISKDGKVLFEKHNISSADKLRLALAVRYIGHSYNASIPDSLNLSQAEDILPSESPEAIRARMSQLVKEGYILSVGKGQYRVYPHKIEPFLDSVEEISGTRTKSSSRKAKTGPKNLAGIGKDIQNLIDGKFFETPKTVQEVKIKLEQEVKFHHISVIDATIRKGFVVSKRLLKRIPNDDGGKAKWKYVIR